MPWALGACASDNGASDEISPEGGAGGVTGGPSTEGGASGAGVECEPPEAPPVDEAGEALALIGSYDDSWASEHEISGSVWQSESSSFHIAAFDNQAGWVIAQNDQANAYFPCSWSRFDWVESASKLYFCQSAFNAESELQAQEVEAADLTDPETSGCGGFPWTELRAR